MTEIEASLTALGGALDYPPGNDLIANVSSRLGDRALASPDEVPALRRSLGSKRVVAMLAAAAVVLAIGAIPSSRSAIANLFRSGGVELRNAKDFDHPKVRATTTTIVRSPLEAAQHAVEFPVRLPQLVPVDPAGCQRLGQRRHRAWLVLQLHDELFGHRTPLDRHARHPILAEVGAVVRSGRCPRPSQKRS